MDSRNLRINVWASCERTTVRVIGSHASRVIFYGAQKPRASDVFFTSRQKRRFIFVFHSWSRASNYSEIEKRRFASGSSRFHAPWKIQPPNEGRKKRFVLFVTAGDTNRRERCFLFSFSRHNRDLWTNLPRNRILFASVRLARLTLNHRFHGSQVLPIVSLSSAKEFIKSIKSPDLFVFSLETFFRQRYPTFETK